MKRLFLLMVLLCFELMILLAQKDECGKLSKKYRKQFEEAVSYFNMAMSYRIKQPDRADKLFDEAQRQFKELLIDNSDYAKLYFYLGCIDVFKTFSNLNSAEKNFKKSIELCPEAMSESYFHLSKIYLGQGKFEESLKNIQEFIKLEQETHRDSLLEEARKVEQHCKLAINLLKNPVPFSPKVVPNLSTPSDEYLFIISPDNEWAFFTRVYKEKKVLAWGEEIEEREKFCYSRRRGDSKIEWTEPDFEVGEALPEPFNKAQNEGGATITLDNKTMVFTICTYDKVKKKSNCDLYEVNKSGSFWDNLRPLEEINTPDFWESQPSISADGNTLFFVSDRPGGYGGYDIYISHRKEDGKWSKPVNAGSNINTSANEKSPFIHSDSQTLYFSSQGWPGLGGYDIFYSRLKPDGSWETPRNIGYPINTREDDAGFFVSFDGKYGFFVSNNQKEGVGGWDLYYFPLPESVKPQKISMLKGEVQKQNSEKDFSNTKVEIRNLENKEIKQIPVDIETGQYVAILPINSKFVVTVKEPEYVYESFYVSTVENEAPQKIDLQAELKPIEVGMHYTINNIYFKYNSFELTDDSKKVLDEFVAFLNENPTIKIEIQGHTDNIGTEEFNKTLSENRAKAVYEYLIENGISSNRLSYKGYGFSKPIADNNTEEGRARNRRTEFVILAK
ncbi:MAG: OmpA family protein [Bacteroidales bacterium]|nr:OmpA family protein [Bacteroidales bacterium]